MYRQVVGIPMGTNCAPLVADLFLFCYEREFMMSLSGDKQVDIIDAFNTTSRYLDDILNINNVYFDTMVTTITNRRNTPWHREEEPLNHHETPGRQIKQSSQLSFLHQDDCNTRMDIM